MFKKENIDNIQENKFQKFIRKQRACILKMTRKHQHEMNKIINQNEKERTMKIKYKKRTNGEWDYRIVGANGEILLVSEGYSSKSNMKLGIKNFLDGISDLERKYWSQDPKKINENLSNIEEDK